MLLLKFSAWCVIVCKHRENNCSEMMNWTHYFCMSTFLFQLPYLGLIGKIAQYVHILGF